MKYRLLLLAEGETPLDLAVTVLAACAERKDMDTIIARVFNPGEAPPGVQTFKPAKRGAKGRRVKVFSVEDEGNTQFRAGDVFDSASAASRAVGRADNAVALALTLAKSKGDKTAIVRGLELGYEDEDGRVE